MEDTESEQTGIQNNERSIVGSAVRKIANVTMKTPQKVSSRLEALGDLTLRGFYRTNYSFWSALGYQSKTPEQRMEEAEMDVSLPY